ncbi:hypothetical protein VV089_17775 [Candidatus Merdisoma sp. JLR.KK011]|uniref:hypothetical protein n=1 Tax=Candidatus Merdisoma sp. JLR.KK011 TaxID=3114299 RepID=UPI002FF048E8
MKKCGWIIILLGMVLYFSSCIHTDTKTLLRGLNVIEKVEVQNLEIPISETKERHIYNEEDDEKNRFLQFLNDEIPLVMTYIQIPQKPFMPVKYIWGTVRTTLCRISIV